MIRIVAWKAGAVATQAALRNLIGTSPKTIESTEEAGLADLVAAIAAREQLDAFIGDVARSANRGGASWAAIARCLGITRQSAWERYARRSEPRHLASADA